MYRRDRDITREIPGYRRMLAHITPGRHAAQVTYTQRLDVTETLAWMARTREETGERVTLLHVFIAAAGRLFHARPKMNRYVTGSRFFQRDGVRISLSAKKKMEDGAPVVVLPLDVEPDATPVDICTALAERLEAPRKGEVLHQEKENDLLLMLPGFLLGWLLSLAFWLDRRHWLPAALVDPDPMFCSLFIANLGSVGLGVAHHHLFEWGNCPFFAVIGRIEEVDGRSMVEVGWTFDERVEDGLACALALEDLTVLVQDPAGFS
ncbi:MAG: 2-oxo acid dehydrogenase subunit E2 [Proteobacteria bacterium]|nr:2-oxo acid dehydrogenase subunit E2 [Pseudomonadota bacterium]MCP4917258.1 2-oxo acid dehydrogenase subunit E2 [Pseudomonadota bacterium]